MRKRATVTTGPATNPPRTDNRDTTAPRRIRGNTRPLPMTTLRAPYDGNTATIPDHDTENATNYSPEKETVDRWLVVVFTGETIETAIDARFYMGRSSQAQVVYCSLWAHSRQRDRFIAGRGQAGGCGYHKLSAALDEALASAGVKLGKRIDGAGETAMRHALLAVASALGYDGCPIEVIS